MHTHSEEHDRVEVNRCARCVLGHFVAKVHVVTEACSLVLVQEVGVGLVCPNARSKEAMHHHVCKPSESMEVL